MIAPDAILELFPPRGLDQSILVVIVISLMFRLLCTERLGWVFGGLVVPGYLASVFVIQPVAGAVVAFEALLTLAIVRVVSDVLSVTRAWSSFFGRERFFLILVVSVLVRQNTEIWLLPHALGWLDGRFGTHLHLAREFSSIGLVLVPLTANMLWGVELRRGLVQVGVPILLTWALLTFVLLPHTNLSFSNLELVYEDVALDFLRSPKAYVILLVGAAIAARANLRYGWDFGGILVPALLAIACFSPWRLLTTAVEAIVLVGAVRLLLRAPFLASRNVEGPRKAALVIGVSFLLKYVVGWVLGDQLPGIKGTDFFGFGYLLPSLLAIKMLDAKAVARILLPTFQVAAVALVVGSGIGFGLEQLLPVRAAAAVALPVVARGPDRLHQSALGCMTAARIQARHPAARVPTHEELQAYETIWAGIDLWLETGADRPHDAQLARIGLELRVLDGETFALLEQASATYGRRGFSGDPRRGWDVAVLKPGAPGPVLEIPRPAGEAPAAEAATVLCARLRCRAIVASGVDAEPDVAPIRRIHRAVRAPIVQVRADATAGPGRPWLHVDGGLPPALDVGALGPVEVTWQPPPAPLGGFEAQGGLAILRVHPRDLAALLLDAAPALPAPTPEVHVATRLVAGATTRALAAPRAIPMPSLTELELLEELGGALHAAVPLVDEDAARALHQRASLLGYALVRLPDGAGSGREVMLLAPPEGLGWGVLAARRGAAPIAVEVPHPGREPGSGRLGTELWLELDGQLLLVATQEDTSIDRDPGTPFQAFHQAIDRAVGADGVILQVRGRGASRPLTADLVVGLGRPLLDAEQVPEGVRRVLGPEGPLAWLGAPLLADGADEVLGLTGAGSASLRYSARVGHAQAAILWLSERAREPFRSRAAPAEWNRLFPTGIALTVVSPEEALTAPTLAPPPARPSALLRDRFGRLAGIALRYAELGNPHILRKIVDAGDVVEAGFDAARGATFLVLEASEGREVMRGLVLLSAGSVQAELAAGTADLGPRLATALFRRSRLITLHGVRP